MLNKHTRDRLRRLNSHRNGKAAKAAADRTETQHGADDDAQIDNRDSLKSTESRSLSSEFNDAREFKDLLRRRMAGQTNEISLPSGLRGLSVLPEPSVSTLSIGHQISNDSGQHWLVERRLDALWPDAAGHIADWQQLPPRAEPVATPPTSSKKTTSKKPTASRRKQYEDYESFRTSFPHECVFLDLETCGLAGSSIFLSGLLHHNKGYWTLSQYWARNYAEERAMLASVKQCLLDKHVLITFNGKSFDWPQVRDRCTLHAGTADCGLPELIHVDLLHLSRQRWRAMLPDCKLQTLERFICGRHRTGDIPGRDIPAAYDKYVRTGATDQMDSVLHHNALDLITLLEIAMRWDNRETPRRNVG